ncbi:MAG TPA: glycosyltransferase family 2 protein [Chitinophagaceae bacterium]
MNVQKLSILIPCYNEENTIKNTLKKVLEANCSLHKEIIVINDGSTDSSTEVIQNFIEIHRHASIKLYNHEINKGKGACIKTGMLYATGDVILIQDADMEYSPDEYPKLLHPILDGHADVVYGSRFRGSEAHRVLFFSHTIGNKFLTFFSNVFTGLNLSDMETGYKVFTSETIKKIRLKEDRFGFEPEFTAKISKIKHIRIYEVGIAYYGRSYKDGKKISWQDGLRAIYCILKYNIFSKQNN